MSNTSDRNDHFVAIETSQQLGKPSGAPSGLHSGMDPPSFEEAINPSITPPPSYESLFGRVKEAQKSSKGVFDFTKNLFVLLLGSIGCVVILIATVVVPIAMVVMGSLYMYQCPQGENIPVYLLVGGLLGIFKEVLHLSVRFRKTAEEIDAERVRYNPAHTLLFWLMVGWFILGSLWVYELYEPNYDPDQGPYCNKTLYLFAYWLITSIYICLGFTTLCLCCLAVTTLWLCPELPRCELPFSKGVFSFIVLPKLTRYRFFQRIWRAKGREEKFRSSEEESVWKPPRIFCLLCFDASQKLFIKRAGNVLKTV